MPSSRNGMCKGPEAGPGERGKVERKGGGRPDHAGPVGLGKDLGIFFLSEMEPGRF